MNPFLDAAAFADMFRPLSDAEELLVTPLLEVVSTWIRDRKPGIADDDAAAIVVTFEVVREALAYGRFGGLSQFKETTSHSESSGTFTSRDIERFISGRHRQILGLGSTTGARGHFPVCDY
jgi:hypothetical protein